ncbi:transmembrane protein 145 [Octopus bimaculoides]|uniref:transmembrane protein 145 n=1 Tax=Octopus bimaculoides TaxID=37653 RepID=UPI00071DCB69|nr:transmembrane protein 145 [Octopus bimaculoides]|eukprot:XP_014777444.1 PREDICTED: transmembrane protein 145-like [Octopus bimaculoides]
MRDLGVALKETVEWTFRFSSNMNKKCYCLWLCLLVVSCSKCVDMKRVTGHLVTKENWKFLTRFCFLSGDDQNRLGSVQYSFQFPASYQGMQLYFYFDDQWKEIYDSEKTCEDKVSVLQPDYFQIIDLSEDYEWSGCQLMNHSGYSYNKCDGIRFFRSIRPRWWFITVGRCKPVNNNGINLTYYLHLTNGNLGDYFHRELSADQFTILEVDIAFLIFFVILACVAVVFSIILRNRQLYHSTYKMFIFSIMMYIGFLFFICIHYGKYAETGIEKREYKILAYICQAVSVMTFQLMLILLGKGFTITRGYISQIGSIKVAVFMTVYVFIYVGIFIWEAEFFDPGIVLYRYESPPGYGLIGMRVVGWLWFCYAIVTTIKHHIEKLSFYIFFFFVFTLWFWATVITFLVANNAVPWHLREKIVNGVEIFIDFYAHLVFLFLTSPVLINRIFPFHIKTSQICPVEDGDCISGGGEGDIQNIQLSTVSHSYIMDRGPNIANLFVTSHTLSTKPGQTAVSPESLLTRPVMPLPATSVSSRDTSLTDVLPPGARKPSPPPSYDVLFKAKGGS